MPGTMQPRNSMIRLRSLARPALKDIVPKNCQPEWKNGRIERQAVVLKAVQTLDFERLLTCSTTTGTRTAWERPGLCPQFSANVIQPVITGYNLICGC
jgi:hypothetical protein